MKKNDGSAHRLIYTELDTLIKKHYWDADYILPSEKHFCDKYGVSRNTVRRAFFELEKESRIIRLRGRGTTINRKPEKRREDHVPCISLLLPLHASSNYLNKVLDGAVGAVERLGGEVRLKSAPLTRDWAFEVLRSQQVRGPDGILFYPWTNPNDESGGRELIETLEMLEIPVVMVDMPILKENGEEFHTGLVTSNNYYDVKDATGRLLAAGHRRIGYLDTARVHRNKGLSERRRGYADAMIGAGLEPECFWVEEHRPDGNGTVSSVIRAKVKAGELTAMVCSYDEVTIWLINECRRNGLAIPGDLSILSASLIYRPYDPVPVAMIDQKAEAIGDAAAELLFRQIKSGRRERETIAISGEFILNGGIREI